MAGTRSFIQLPVDGAGKMVDSWAYTESGNTVYSQVASLAASDGSQVFQPVVTLSDTFTNPAVGTLGAHGLVYNGSTWDLCRTANASDVSTGIGLAGTGTLGYDGSVWHRTGVVAPGDSDSNQNAYLVAGNRHAVTYSATGTGAVTATSLDASAYRSFTFDVVATTSGTITVQGSQDNANWYGLPFVAVGAYNNVPVNSVALTSTRQIFTGPVNTRYIRLNLTAISGTVSGTLTLNSIPPSLWSATYSSSSTPTQTPADAATAGTSLEVQDFNMVFNGSTWDRVRSAASATGTTGTGLLGSAAMGFDGTNYRIIGTATPADALAPTYALDTLSFTMLWNGTTWNRAKDVTGGRATTGSGVPASGTLGQYASTLPTVTSGNYEVMQVDPSGRQLANISKGSAASAATLTQIVSATSSTTLLAAHVGPSATGRMGAYFYNPSVGATLYIAFGTTVSTTAYTVAIPPGGYYELPMAPVWQGQITGVWSGTDGSAVQITELV
jgi:hypothetical protein